MSHGSKSPWLRVCLECSWEAPGKAGGEGRAQEREDGLGGKGGREGGNHDRKKAVLEQEIKGRGCVLVLSFTVLFKKKRRKRKKVIESESFRKPKTPPGWAGGAERATPRHAFGWACCGDEGRAGRERAGVREGHRLGWTCLGASRRRWKNSLPQTKSIRG